MKNFRALEILKEMRDQNEDVADPEALKELDEAIAELEALQSNEHAYVFDSGSTWYYVTPSGTINNFIVHSGLSPKGAYVLSKVHTLYKTWKEANEALCEYNKTFTTFKGAMR